MALLQGGTICLLTDPIRTEGVAFSQLMTVFQFFKRSPLNKGTVPLVKSFDIS